MADLVYWKAKNSKCINRGFRLRENAETLVNSSVRNAAMTRGA